MSNGAGRIERRVYTDEFKAEAIKLVLEHGYTCDAAGQKLGVPPKTVANWVRPYRRDGRGRIVVQGVPSDDPAVLKAENAELRKQLRRAEMKRDILKKFSIYASSQMPGGLP